MYIFLLCIITYILTFILIRLLRPFAFHLRLIDSPNMRKKHEGDVPLIGGIGLFGGMSFGVLISNISLSPYYVLFFGCLILMIVGVFDDLCEFSPRSKFIFQFFVAFLLVAIGKVSVQSLGDLFFCGPIYLGILSIPFSIISIVGVINAINMIDGVDGLMGVVSIMQFVFLMVLAIMTAQYSMAITIGTIISALLGFLTFNFPLVNKQMRVFAGDSGTMIVGVLTAWVAIVLSQTNHIMPITFLWIVALPVFDMCNVVYRRVCSKKSPLHADREHFHFLLRSLGMHELGIDMLMMGLSFLFGLIGLFGNYLKINEGWMFVAFVLAFALYFFVINRLSTISKLLKLCVSKSSFDNTDSQFV